MPNLDAAESMACFLRIADLELRKGDDGQSIEDTEMRRVAIELAKLHAAGHFPDIAEPGLLAALLHLFGATIVENPPTEPAGQNTSAALTETQRVNIPHGLRGKALHEFLERDLKNAFGKEFVAL